MEPRWMLEQEWVLQQKGDNSPWQKTMAKDKNMAKDIQLEFEAVHLVIYFEMQ